MNEEIYKCPNCNVSFPAAFVTKAGFNVCPTCGNLLPETIDHIDNYFRIIQLVEPLSNAKNLLLKSESAAAVRDALVTFENIVREKAGLSDLMGPDLMAKAFSFKYDSKTNTITQEPRIAINSLSNVTERNEQEGIRFLAMGLMQGIRNIYMHTPGTEKLYYCLQIITTTDLLLKQVLGWESVARS